MRRRLGWAEDDVVALHSGNMGLKQGLKYLVAAARLASAPVRVVLMGDGSQRAALEGLGAGVERLSFLPPSDSADFPDVLASADVLVVNERATAVDMSLPSKLTSYFSVGRPVVAAVPAGGGTAAEVDRSCGGVLVPPEEPVALLLLLSWGGPGAWEWPGRWGPSPNRITCRSSPPGSVQCRLPALRRCGGESRDSFAASSSG